MLNEVYLTLLLATLKIQLLCPLMKMFAINVKIIYHLIFFLNYENKVFYFMFF